MEKRESKIVERNSPSSILDPNPRTHRGAQARVDEISLKIEEGGWRIVERNHPSSIFEREE
jgi:hypothetical protein